jgi:hypothetical protein
MKYSSRENQSDNQKFSGSPVGGHIDNILRWLAGLIDWTEQEKEDAGIYLGEQND